MGENANSIKSEANHHIVDEVSNNMMFEFTKFTSNPIERMNNTYSSYQISDEIDSSATRNKSASRLKFNVLKLFKPGEILNSLIDS